MIWSKVAKDLLEITDIFVLRKDILAVFLILILNQILELTIEKGKNPIKIHEILC